MVRLRDRMGATLGALVIATTVLIAGGPALAQTGGYPPGSSVPSCTPGNVDLGTKDVGQTVTFVLCGGFTDGTAVTVTVNGMVVGTKTPVNGAVTVVITIVSTSVLSVLDPVNAPAQCGTNTAVATGSGTPGTSTGTFSLNCPSTTTTTAAGATTTTAAPGATTTTAAGVTTTTKGGGALAFTGARVLELLLIALGLIILGVLLVAAQRRRRQQTL